MRECRDEKNKIVKWPRCSVFFLLFCFFFFSSFCGMYKCFKSTPGSFSFFFFFFFACSPFETGRRAQRDHDVGASEQFAHLLNIYLGVCVCGGGVFFWMYLSLSLFRLWWTFLVFWHYKSLQISNYNMMTKCLSGLPAKFILSCKILGKQL